jgi:copper resistance protein B
MKTLIALLLLGTAAPVLAQHAGHTMPMPKPSPTPTTKVAPKPQPKPAAAPAKKAPVPAKKPVATQVKKTAPKPTPVTVVKSKPSEAMDSGTMTDEAASVQDTSEAMDHSQMDHDAMEAPEMDHSEMDHSTMGHKAMAMPIPKGSPPAAAGSGPARGAEAIWGAEEMRASREALVDETGNQSIFWFQGDRAEYRIRDNKDGYLWDVQGYYGGDIDKFWFKSEGEGSFGEKIETAEVQALWSHAIAPFFDFQAGVRQDLSGPNRTHAVIGIQGLAPYLFEVDAAAFLSNKGDLTGRIEAELDQKITQRLILQPRAELSLAAQDIPELGIGGGVDAIEAGLRLRYEIAREFAPYIGIDQEWKVGNGADFARAAGEDPSVTNYVVGIRFWF